jgi:hypothetical protein
MAFIGTNVTDESIVSDLTVVRQLFGKPICHLPSSLSIRFLDYRCFELELRCIFT